MPLSVWRCSRGSLLDAFSAVSRIQTRHRFNSVVETGIPGFIPQGSDERELQGPVPSSCPGHVICSCIGHNSTGETHGYPQSKKTLVPEIFG